MTNEEIEVLEEQIRVKLEEALTAAGLKKAGDGTIFDRGVWNGVYTELCVKVPYTKSYRREPIKDAICIQYRGDYDGRTKTRRSKLANIKYDAIVEDIKQYVEMRERQYKHETYTKRMRETNQVHADQLTEDLGLYKYQIMPSGTFEGKVIYDVGKVTGTPDQIRRLHELLQEIKG